MSVRRGMSCAVIAGVLSVLAACSSTPKKDDMAGKLALQEQVNENMASADKALKAGQTDKAMEQLDAAIKVDPASKAPWLKKAQIHFDARQYGQAITAAQEVLQRDMSDLTAKSILAVSGLRVSATALEQLRKVNEVNGSARDEAESVAKLIRDALGEPILVPPPAAGTGGGASEPARGVAAGGKSSGWSGNRAAARMAVPASAPRPLNSSSTGTAAAPVAAPSVKPAVAATANNSRAGSPSGRNNPFGALQ